MDEGFFQFRPLEVLLAIGMYSTLLVESTVDLLK